MTDRRQVGRLLRGRLDLRAVTPRLTIGAVLLFWVAVGLVGCILTGCEAAGVAHVARPDTPARHACLERGR